MAATEHTGGREVLTLRYWTVGHYGRSPKKKLKLLWGLPACWTISDRYTHTHSGHLPRVLYRTNELPKRYPPPLISTVLNTCDTTATVSVNIQDWYIQLYTLLYSLKNISEIILIEREMINNKWSKWLLIF